MTTNVLTASAFIAFIMCFACTMGWCSPPVHAEGAPLSAAQQQLAIRVARIAAHEGALANVADVDLVWQVTESRAKTTAKRSAFLAAHSGRALGVKPCTTGDGNCAWSPLLDHKGTIPASVAAGDTGYWRAVTIPQWKRVLERAEELVSGASYRKPCPVDPYTWGSVKLDSKHAAADGLYPIGCTDRNGSALLNDGFAFRAPHVIP